MGEHKKAHTDAAITPPLLVCYVVPITDEIPNKASFHCKSKDGLSFISNK